MSRGEQGRPPVPAAPSNRRPWYEWYEPGVPHELALPDQPLHQYLTGTAARYPERDAVRFMGAALSYRELDQAAGRFANALITLGVQPGDRLALLLPNCPQFVIAYYGGLRAGAVICPVNPTYAPPELRFQLVDCGAKAVVCLSLFYPTIEGIRGELPNLEHVVVSNIKEYLPTLSQFVFTVARERREGHHVRLPDDGHTHWWHTLLERAADDDPNVTSGVEDLASLQYTAGTTGTPKGVMLTHRNLAIGGLQARAWLANSARLDGADAVLGVIPLFHTYAQTTVMNFPIFTGGTMVLQPRFVPKDVLSAIQSERPTFFPGVPAMYRVLADHRDAAKYDLTSLRACISGSAPLPEEVQVRFEALSGTRLIEGYGMTEAPVTHCNPVHGERRIGTVGVPIPNTDAAIVDMETGTRPVENGEPGELIVRGPQVMRGYWQRPDETAAALRDGWLFTGDIARMDDEGFFQLVDRKKDMIITGGLKVFPSQVEEVIAGHPAVREAVAIGIPDTRRGEVVKLFVVLNEGMTAGEREIIEFCAARMAHFKVPRAVEFRDELPKSVIGKVLRRQLAEEERERRSVRDGHAAGEEGFRQ